MDKFKGVEIPPKLVKLNKCNGFDFKLVPSTYSLDRNNLEPQNRKCDIRTH